MRCQTSSGPVRCCSSVRPPSVEPDVDVACAPTRQVTVDTSYIYRALPWAFITIRA